MRCAVWLCLVGISLSSCASPPAAQRAAFLPPDTFGTYLDNDVGAINFAAWAFAAPGRIAGNPADAARAVMALAYLPNELSHNPRWVGIDPAVKRQMVRADDQVRALLGIRADAPAQLVVNTMLALSLDLQSGNRPAALQVLAGPIFTLPPARTLAVLSAMPYVQTANLATMRASNQLTMDNAATF